MSKTIVYIGGFELPDKNAAAHRVLSNAKILREIGYKVVFIGVDKSLKQNSNIFNTQCEVQGFESYSVPYPKGSKSWFEFLTDISSYIKVIEQQNNVEMLILYNFQALALKKLMTYCGKNNIKCCADVTEWRSTKGENIVYRIIKGSDTLIRMKLLHKKLDGLIVISNYLKDYYAGNRNVVLIPTLVDISEEKWNNPYSKSRDELLLTYAGNPGYKDRIDVLIKAIGKTHRPCRLDIIGITENQFLTYYPNMKDDIQDERIIFHGRVSHIEALSFVKKANYSCFFRENDRVSNAGFPTKLSEAITCGTPVITNDTSDIRKYVNCGCNGYLLSAIDSVEIANILENAKPEIIVDKELFEYKKYKEEFEEFLS